MNTTDNELYESLAYSLRHLSNEELIKLVYLLTLEGLHTAGRKSKKKTVPDTQKGEKDEI